MTSTVVPIFVLGAPLSERASSQMKMRLRVPKSARAARARTKKGGNAQCPQGGIAQIYLPKFPFYSLVSLPIFSFLKNRIKNTKKT